MDELQASQYPSCLKTAGHPCLQGQRALLTSGCSGFFFHTSFVWAAAVEFGVHSMRRELHAERAC